jgi:branched-subunit amino acid aminotransferase/4-amino-4-deoxychorismate lyase
VQKLYPDDLLNADAVYLTNALRGIITSKLTANGREE